MGASNLKWGLFRPAFRSLGRVSQGVSLGYKYGFDSGEMLDYVYENRARGRLGIGRLVDRVYLESVGWRGIRARKEVLKAQVTELLLERTRQERSTTVLDIASGPGRYLQEAYMEQQSHAHVNGVQIICRDMDPVGLEQGHRRAEALGLANFRYEAGDACDPASLLTVSAQPDIVIASGLYELLEPPFIRSSMSGVYDILPPGGHFIFTTQVHHPQLELIANVLINRKGEPWVMVCRSLEETEGWARQAGFTVVHSHMEKVGLFGVTVCTKRAGATQTEGGHNP